MISLRSDLRRKVLTYFYTNRLARAYVRQLALRLQVDSTNLSRELARLERDGLLRSEIEGRQRYYSLNRQYPYLKAAFSLLQGTIGLEPTLRTGLLKVNGVESAYLYGSFAKDEADSTSDVDLLIIGHPNAVRLAEEVAALEKLLHREIGYTVFSRAELDRRLSANDPFLSDVWQGKRIELIGDAEDEAAAS